MMKRYALSLILMLVCVSNLLAALPIFDVTRYGAIPNDGTNDKTAIENAIIAAEAAAPAVVYFPRGTYDVTFIQSTAGNIELVGDGAVINQLSTTANQVVYLGADNISMRGFEIDGNFPTNFGGSIDTGTAQSATSSTIVLANAASSANDTYNGMWISITGGTGSGQYRIISDYVGSTRTATLGVNTTWSVTPNSSSTYAIYDGDGIGINMGEFENLQVRDCYIHDTRGPGIIAGTLGRGHRVTNVRVIDAGTDGININADNTVIRDCYVEDWGNAYKFAARAVQVDGQNADMDSFELLDTKLRRTATDETNTDAILIDCGDGDLTDGNPILCGNGGAAIEDGTTALGGSLGYASFKIDAGSGFLFGDSVWIDNSTTTAYNDTSPTIRAIEGVGNVFLRVIDANTITLHASAIGARDNTGLVNLTSTGSGTFYVSAPGRKRVSVTASSGVDASTDRITCTSHGWKTGSMARLTLSSTTATRSSTATGGSSTTIVLDSGASVVDDAYNGSTIYITSGTGVGSIGHCTDYVGSTKTATVTSWSSTAPTSGSGFAIRAHSLPIGLADATTITLNMAYDAAGAGSGATYMRPKRIRNVTIRNVSINHSPSSIDTCNAIKVNNVENLLIDDFKVYQTPDVSAIENASIRLGQGLRRVQITSSRLSGCILNNNISWIPELIIDKCEIGDGANYPLVAIERLGATRFTLSNSTVRFMDFAIRNAAAPIHADSKVERWDIHDNIFECGLDTRGQIFSFASTDFNRSGLIAFRNNNRRNVHPDYNGMTINSVNTSTDILTITGQPQMKSGDQVQIRHNAGGLVGTTNNGWYYYRKLSNTTFSLHTSLANVDADTKVDIGTLSAGATLWAPEIGVQFSGSGNRDLFYINQRTADPSQIVNEAAPSNASFQWHSGDKVWQMNPTADGSPGWVCTATGSPGTWVQMPELETVNHLHSSTTEVGNVGTGVDDLMTYTLPANTLLAAGDVLEIEAGFTFAANGNNKQVILLINGVSHYASGAVAQNAGSMVLKMTVICDSATVTKFSTTVQTTGSGAIPNVALVNGGLLTISNANIIKCTGEATATNDIVQEYLRVRRVPGP